MLKIRFILCIDFGATTVKVAEFEQARRVAAAEELHAQVHGAGGLAEGDREAVVLQTLKEVLAEGAGPVRGECHQRLRARLPGLLKFVKLPAGPRQGQAIINTRRSKMPFPLRRSSGTQILGSTATGERKSCWWPSRTRWSSCSASASRRG